MRAPLFCTDLRLSSDADITRLCSGESILLPIPPSLPPIGEQVATLLAPTRRLLALTNESVDSGAQVQLMQRMWEKAWTNEPFVLARNVCSRMWERFTKGPPDDSP